MTYIFLLFFLFNILSFILTVVDKELAKKNKQRIPENYFFIIAILGGWPLGILTMKIVRHKTLKRSFQVKYFLSICSNLIATGLIIYLF